MEKVKEYDVFISYARSDYENKETKEKIPNSVVSQIKEYLSANNISFWFDEDGIYSGDAFAKEIANSIKNSKLFLFISSAHANKSDWTCREIATATMYKKKILPVKIDNSVYDDSVILYLANLDFVDLTRNQEQGLKAMVRSINNYINNNDSIVTPQVKVNIKDTLLGIANDAPGDICPTDWAGATKYGLQKMFSIKGRMNRPAFWKYSFTILLSLILVSGLFLGLCKFMGLSVGGVAVGMSTLLFLAFILLTLTASIRRFHDIGLDYYGFGPFIYIPAYGIELCCLGIMVIYPISTIWLFPGAIFLSISVVIFIYMLCPNKEHIINKMAQKVNTVGELIWKDIFIGFYKMFSTEGRTTRRELFLFEISLFFVLCLIAILFWLFARLCGFDVSLSLFWGIAPLILFDMFVLSFTAIIRRMHDVGNNGLIVVGALLSLLYLVATFSKWLNNIWLAVGIIFLLLSFVSFVFILMPSSNSIKYGMPKNKVRIIVKEDEN